MRFIAIAIFCLFAASSYAQVPPPQGGGAPDAPRMDNAKKEKTKKQKTVRTRKVKEDKHVKETVYLYGVSSLLGDSLCYITGISRIDNVDMQKRTGFLTFRESYSYQYRVYLEGTLGLKGQTAAILYDTKLKRLQKNYDKMISKYLKTDGAKLVTVNPDEFTFKSVETATE